jgi:hypothetical protein
VGQRTKKTKKGAHHWQRQANAQRKAKRVRHFERAFAKKARHVLKRNGVRAHAQYVRERRQGAVTPPAHKVAPAWLSEQLTDLQQRTQQEQAS